MLNVIKTKEDGLFQNALYAFSSVRNLWFLHNTVRNIWTKPTKLPLLTQRVKITDVGYCLQTDLELIFVLNVYMRRQVHEYDKNIGKPRDASWSLLNICRNQNRILHI